MRLGCIVSHKIPSYENFFLKVLRSGNKANTGSLEGLRWHHLRLWRSFDHRLPGIGGARNHKPKVKVPFCGMGMNTKSIYKGQGRE